MLKKKATDLNGIQLCVKFTKSVVLDKIHMCGLCLLIQTKINFWCRLLMPDFIDVIIRHIVWPVDG